MTSPATPEWSNGQRCCHCGAWCIDACTRCGAPQCCPQCCQISNLEALRSETGTQDAAGNPKPEPTVLERLAVEALNEVKAWRDSDGNEGFPQSTRERVDAALMFYEQRRMQRPAQCPHAAPFVYCEICKVDPCPLGLRKAGRRGC